MGGTPDLSRNLACLTDEEKEAREQLAALLLCPQKSSLVAFRRAAADGDAVVATFARWEPSADGGGVVVLGKDAVQLRIEAPESDSSSRSTSWRLGTHAPMLLELALMLLPDGQDFFVAVLNCAALAALLENRLEPAAAKAALGSPAASSLYPVCEGDKAVIGAYRENSVVGQAVVRALRIASERSWPPASG